MIGQAPIIAPGTQSAVTRQASPLSPGVIALGATGAGTAMASARLLGTLVAFALLAIASGVVISAGDYRFSVLFILAALFIFSAYLACGAASRKRSNILRQGAGCMARLLLRNTISK